MSFPTSKIKSEKELETLVIEVRNNLNDHKVMFNYPETLKEKIDLGFWEAFYKEIDKLNKDTLDKITKRGGVYAIFEKLSNKKSELKYIGQTDADGSKSRIRSHVVWRNKDTPSGKYTGSKFDEVFQCVTSGKEIYISFCEIDPPSLRHYVEEKLFHTVTNGWNKHGVRAKKT